MPDVASEVAVPPIDVLDGSIRRGTGSGNVVAEPHDAENPTAVGHQHAVFQAGAGMKGLDAGVGVRRVDVAGRDGSIGSNRRHIRLGLRVEQPVLKVLEPPSTDRRLARKFNSTQEGNHGLGGGKPGALPVK